MVYVAISKNLKAVEYVLMYVEESGRALTTVTEENALSMKNLIKENMRITNKDIQHILQIRLRSILSNLQGHHRTGQRHSAYTADSIEKYTLKSTRASSREDDNFRPGAFMISFEITKLNVALSNETNPYQNEASEKCRLNYDRKFSSLLDDFNDLYPDLIDKLFVNWPFHRDHIIHLARQYNDEILQDILSCLDEDNVIQDTINTTAFKVLPFLMNISTIRKAKMEKRWRPSGNETLQGFITHVKTSVDLETVITLRKEQIASLSFTI
ncbi:hypothetical protein EVAR_97885_1 [Eumeta japonica]|uniref:Uncharacterized protein n=1 Tax=Eumeta variegata TaxID=151549 RepID=A0A4C1WDZ2_EUMVA|nr:hypothetical protein EVAR_97885_1 [Eumeta japonica]